MNIKDIISMLGALAVFLFGMSTMTSGLEKLASGKLASLLEKLTDNIFKGVLLGAVVAGMVHSSAATTVMCIGFVNAGILQLRQAVGVIMGANIGAEDCTCISWQQPVRRCTDTRTGRDGWKPAPGRRMRHSPHPQKLSSFFR